MPRAEYAKCKVCGRRREEVGLMSWTRLCGDCAAVRLEENIDGIHFKRGEPWRRWRRAMAACVGAVLPEDS